MVKPKNYTKSTSTCRECTIHLRKRLHNVTFKRRAPRAVSEIRKFAKKQMGTEDVRIDVNLNQYIWSKGVRNVPTRVRVLLTKKRNEDEDSENEMYTLVQWVQVDSFKGLLNEKSAQ
eukprot:TRINITY_DN98445_c0_g1_i1.p1 TRINITY_DN98445_c0_g1~~TRINITY_DN98445_c0_g1_i1.p1  ORF type:complete len:117 (+),score=16.57 TRINITY_DN98445_c0_g1_i1:63-413(+)